MDSLFAVAPKNNILPKLVSVPTMGATTRVIDVVQTHGRSFAVRPLSYPLKAPLRSVEIADIVVVSSSVDARGVISREALFVALKTEKDPWTPSLSYSSGSTNNELRMYAHWPDFEWVTNSMSAFGPRAPNPDACPAAQVAVTDRYNAIDPYTFELRRGLTPQPLQRPTPGHWKDIFQPASRMSEQWARCMNRDLGVPAGPPVTGDIGWPRIVEDILSVIWPGTFAGSVRHLWESTERLERGPGGRVPYLLRHEPFFGAPAASAPRQASPADERRRGRSKLLVHTWEISDEYLQSPETEFVVVESPFAMYQE